MEPISERLSKILAIVNREPRPPSKLGRPGLGAQGGRATGSQEWISGVPLSPNAIVKTCAVDDIGKSLNHDLTGVTARYMKHTCSTLLKRKERDMRAWQADKKVTTFNPAFSVGRQRNRTDGWATNILGKSYETPALRKRMSERVAKTREAVMIQNETEESVVDTVGSPLHSILRSTSCNESSILEDEMEPDSLRRTASQIVLETSRSTLELAWEEGTVSVTCSIPVTNESTAAEVLKSLTDSTNPSLAKHGSAQVTIDFSCTGDGTAPVQLKLPSPDSSALEEVPSFSHEIEVEEIEIIVEKAADHSKIEENLNPAKLVGLVLTYSNSEDPVKVDLVASGDTKLPPNVTRAGDKALATSVVSFPYHRLVPESVLGAGATHEVMEIKDARFPEVRPPLRHIQTGKAPQPEITEHESGTLMPRTRNTSLSQAKRSKSKRILSKILCLGKKPSQ